MANRVVERVNAGFTRLGDGASALVERYLPDAFIFAVLLTFLTMLLALAFTDRGPGEIAAHWGEGFWFVLEFSMQASLALLTGWALADSPPVKRVLRAIAEKPNSQMQAIFTVALAGQLLGLFHWGVVLIAGAILAREVGIAMDRQGIPVHYPLLVATAYAGLLPWHQGLSGAALLLSATPDHFLVDTIGSIPVSETLFTFHNLLVAGGVVLVTVVIMPLMAPDREDAITIPEEKLRGAGVAADGGEPEGRPSSDGPATDGGEPVEPHRRDASRLKRALLESRLLCVGLGLLVWAYLLYLFATEPFMEVFDLNVFISVMFGLGFLLHTTLGSYFGVLRDAIEGASQIIIQFQFYGGIMGIMAWSGLAELIAQTAAGLASETTWYFYVFVSAGIVNFFVPSGGGQWVVTGEVFAQATAEIPGTTQERMLVAFAMGDQWTNMIQPFWALPVLGIAGLSIRDMMGYAAVLFVFSGLVLSAGTLLMGMGVI